MSQSISNGYSNGIHDQSLNGQMPLAQVSHLQMQTSDNFSIDPSVPESALPAIANFSNPLSVPTTEFNPSILPPPPPLLRAPQWNESAGAAPMAETTPLSGQHSMRNLLTTYPSPAESGFGSPSLNSTGMYTFNGHSLHMPPPMPTSNPITFQESVNSPYNSNKRMKLSPRTEAFGRTAANYQRAGSYGPNDIDEGPRVQFNPNTPTFFPSYLSNPLTPATSSTHTQDNEDRRISVSSLLSEDPEPEDGKSSNQNDQNAVSGTEEQIPRRGSLHQRMVSYSETETYGQDRGNVDLDIPRNNDTMAISGMSPSEHSDFEAWLNDTDLGVPEFGFGLVSRETVFAKGGYYSSPVPIKISRKLEPLPRTLSENPMNLLYFHHFLNHTARILVPHDCPENPFKTILPKSKFAAPLLLAVFD